MDERSRRIAEGFRMIWNVQNPDSRVGRVVELKPKGGQESERVK